MSEYEYWVVEDHKMGIFWLKLNRPNKRNAFNEAVALELGEVLDEFRTNEEIRILILSSTSDAFFSAGADIDWFAAINGEEAEEISKKSHEIFGKLQELPFPVIAAIKGVCITAGLEVILCADMIYVADNAKLGLIETVFGITPGGGGTQRLVRLIGPNRAKEMIFNARIIGAEEAERIGLANAMFPLEGFEEKIDRIARKMLMNDQGAISRCKKLINLATYSNDEGFREEQYSFNTSFASGEPRSRLTEYKKQQEREKRRKERKQKKAEIKK
ncbi:MAG: enoyl-CoA hydratase/isomerase family protein [Candidatus Lokiarchaeota archaeon]|nr:enoyl-CoA hydratase/isomerase family protein [Candidatus Lokiarchaeota archaeon]